MNITDIIDKHEPVAWLDVEKLKPNGLAYAHTQQEAESEIPLYTCATVEKMLGEVLASNQESKEEVNDVRLDMDSNFTSAGQQWHVDGSVSLGQSVGNGENQEASNIQPQRKYDAILRLDGIDEYGPVLGWCKHWNELPIGTVFYVAAPSPAKEQG